MTADSSLADIFKALAESPDVSAAICRAAAAGKLHGEKSVKEIASASGISQGRRYKVERLLESGASLGVFKKCSTTFWKVESGIDFNRLAAMLEGAALYLKSVYHPEETANVVLTLPPSPSQIEGALDRMGFRSAFLENTQEIFANLAKSAKHRFLVMTPFIDPDGGKKLVKLFSNVSHGVRKQLIVRCAYGVPPEGLKDYQAELKAVGVKISNYWVPKAQAGTYETFHAKIMLSDTNRCYVGSANMTQASLNVSLELGFLVEGEAAKTVGWMCDAILGIAPENN